ncbi:uncharacterized protein BDR25DRAFT_285642 [Lindgomyces ingoldianus]|uniref:Uncharacterized protein n=1 Tax=Lindgomyces ingoldianus TaxID=673940 RepID=A0ACB6QW70_9PLEO|nr:uncharacterized protein BDR25DRAFT_285642 [Lindgomyces ingoldianus]KAF2471181.1 hypothetical protein BDR25DRAFT_285642 [Lindgomyces ingoldianus]
MAPRGGRPDSTSARDDTADNHDRDRNKDRGRNVRNGERDRVGTPTRDSNPPSRARLDSPNGPPRSPRERGVRRNYDARDRYGGRDRSRSPHRRGGRRHDRSPDRRDKKDRDDNDRSTYRDREPPKGPRGGGAYRKPDTRPAAPAKTPTPAPVKAEPKEVEMEDVMQDCPEGMDPEDWMMHRLMGFTQFKSTKDTKVPGNDKNYGVRKDKLMAARQYMNRQGGFNRPLSPSRN